MLTVKKNAVNPTLTNIHLEGDVGPDSDLPNNIGQNFKGEVHVYCKGLTRINSIGVKAWITFFSGLRNKGVQLKFFECPSFLVEQMNMISNFVGPGELQSLYLPYLCNKCSAELAGLFKKDDLIKLNFNPPVMKCPKCGGTAVFDEILDEFFMCLKR